MKNKKSTVVLAFFLGGIGIQKFYLKKRKRNFINEII
jgi:TM2 domain-containing membrane protein YozV